MRNKVVLLLILSTTPAFAGNSEYVCDSALNQIDAFYELATFTDRVSYHQFRSYKENVRIVEETCFSKHRLALKQLRVKYKR